MKGSSDDTIKVFIRIRPLNQKEREKQKSSASCVQILSEQSVRMKDKQTEIQFSFDHIFGMASIQEEVYEKVGRQAVNNAFEGFNGTIFAYGQTSSGKTHTCVGPDYEDKQLRGILPRLVDQIFNRIAQSPSHIEFRIKISMVEIYMEKIKDLFDSSKNDVRIRESKAKGLYLQDVTEQYVASSDETIGLLKKGIANRSTGQTNMNDVSSRSHMVFLITLYQNDLKDSSAKSGKIILVDLAGSEKIGKTGAEGKLLDEAKTINKSLSALGNVINALTDQKVSHIPYRDSKLTRLLQQSLGGNSKTNLIINVSPSILNQPQTLSSLRFGFRAKQIKNKPKVNKQYTVAELLLLLEKTERKNQQLQQIIKQLTATQAKRSVIKKNHPYFIENLLDSDNPILASNLQDNDLDNQTGQNSPPEKQTPIREKVKEMRYETEHNSESDGDEQVKSKHSSSNQKSNLMDSSEKKDIDYLEQKTLLVQEIQNLNYQKTQLNRQYELCKDKYQYLLKQSKYISTKLSSHQKENQKLIQKFISEQMHSQQRESKIKELMAQVDNYEESISNIAALTKSSSVSKVFGSEASKQIDRIIQKARSYKKQEDQQDFERGVVEKENKNESIKEYQKKIKMLEEQISLFKHLQGSKEALITERMTFSKQKQRVYEDLQNRIEKVLELEEKLDEQRDKNKNLAEIVDSDESQKGRKILALQRHLAEVSENYYVLKGQQSSWANNNKKAEKKAQGKDKRIAQLQSEIMSLKEELQIMKMRNQQFQNENSSILDLDLSEDLNKRESKIVKVVTSRSSKIHQ